MRGICIDPEGYTLTRGNVYELELTENPRMFRVQSDNGNYLCLYRDRFIYDEPLKLKLCKIEEEL